VVVLGLAGSVVPQMVVETRQLASQVPQYARRIEVRVNAWLDKPPGPLRHWLANVSGHGGRAEAGLTNAPASERAAEESPPLAGTPASAPQPGFLDGFLERVVNPDALGSAAQWLARALPQAGLWAFGQVTRVFSWLGVLVGLALIPVYTFYFLLEKEGIRSRWTDYLPVADSDFKQELVFVISSINDYLIAFFRGQVLVAICNGLLYTIGYALIGLPYALLMGAVTMVLTFIPFIGAILSVCGALVLAFAQFGDWQHPLLALMVFVVVQNLESLVIQPRILGDRVGLHPLTIIVAVIVGTTLFGGLLGGVLAIPLTAAMRVIMSRYVWQRTQPGAGPVAGGEEAQRGKS
jgi:predicted PurR-regulated permease PerM